MFLSNVLASSALYEFLKSKVGQSVRQVEANYAEVYLSSFPLGIRTCALRRTFVLGGWRQLKTEIT
jgi:hypothetical protein